MIQNRRSVEPQRMVCWSLTDSLLASNRPSVWTDETRSIWRWLNGVEKHE